MNQQNIILGSMAIAVGNNVVANLNRSEPTPWFPTVVGGFALTAGLLVASEFQPTIAQGFAVLILFASLLGPNGTALVNLIVKLTNAEVTEPRSPRPTGGGGMRVTLQ